MVWNNLLTDLEHQTYYAALSDSHWKRLYMGIGTKCAVWSPSPFFYALLKYSYLLTSQITVFVALNWQSAAAVCIWNWLGVCYASLILASHISCSVDAPQLFRMNCAKYFVRHADWLSYNIKCSLCWCFSGFGGWWKSGSVCLHKVIVSSASIGLCYWTHYNCWMMRVIFYFFSVLVDLACPRK